MGRFEPIRWEFEAEMEEVSNSAGFGEVVMDERIMCQDLAVLGSWMQILADSQQKVILVLQLQEFVSPNNHVSLEQAWHWVPKRKSVQLTPWFEFYETLSRRSS